MDFLAISPTVKMYALPDREAVVVENENYPIYFKCYKDMQEREIEMLRELYDTIIYLREMYEMFVTQECEYEVKRKTTGGKQNEQNEQNNEHKRRNTEPCGNDGYISKTTHRRTNSGQILPKRHD